MISPSARRHRLGAEIASLRARAGLTGKELAQRAGLTRERLSMLENGHRSMRVVDTQRILSALNVEAEMWHRFTVMATEATAPGWWTSWGAAMAERESLYVDLETGAQSVREFRHVGIPSLLQTAEYMHSRSQYGTQQTGVLNYDICESTNALMARQAMFMGTCASYDVIIAESALQRPSAPSDISNDQREYLAAICDKSTQISVRILLNKLPLFNYALPSFTFSLYAYPDPGDGTMVAIEQEDEDLLYHRPHDVARFLRLFETIQDAALGPAESAAYLQQLIHATT